MTRNRPMIVALTGGLASGKSEAAQRFGALGVPVIDADVVARELVEPGAPALEEIVAAFGAGVLDGQGRLDRARMRQRVFADAGERRKLESILHPRVRDAMRIFAGASDAPYVLFVIPLLVETNQAHTMDRVIVVDAPRELRASRARDRDGSAPETIAAIMDSQASCADRLTAADIVIENTGNLAALHERVDTVHRECLARAARSTRCRQRALAGASASVKESHSGRGRSGPTGHA